MDENKNINNSEINGFDSVKRGYTVTPDGSFFERRLKENDEVPPVDNSFVDSIIPQTPTEEPAQVEEPVREYSYYEPPQKPQKPKKEKRKYGLGIVVMCVLMAAIIGAASGVGAVLCLKGDTSTADNLPTTSQSGSVTTTTINVDKVSNSAIEAVAEKASPSVVGIRTTMAVNNFFGGSEDYNSGEGSGIIYTSDGYIITNYHVIQTALKSSGSKVNVFLNETTTDSYPATVIGYNINYDLAVIKIEKTGLQAIELGNSDELKRGQFVAAIGCPGGLDFMGSVSYGIISGLNRTVSASTEEAVPLIQTDAAINPGNSGGALLDIEGKLIGVNSSKIASTEYEGMGFAIPVNTVKEICDKIIAKKDDPTPYIGVTLSETYDEDTLNRLGYPSGAVVSSVADDGPAYNAGIRRGDIITQFGDDEISNYNDLYDAVSNCEAGDTVNVKIYRSGRYYTTKITLTSNNAQ